MYLLFSFRRANVKGTVVRSLGGEPAFRYDQNMRWCEGFRPMVSLKNLREVSVEEVRSRALALLRRVPTVGVLAAVRESLGPYLALKT